MTKEQREQWRSEIRHGRNCAGFELMGECTCGLEERLKINQLLDALDAAERELAEMTTDRDLWRDAHNEDCPNAIRAEELERELAQMKQRVEVAEYELRQERGLKALLANGMPPTGNPDFDEVLATHPIAAMINRGWLPGVTGFDDLAALESAICHFYGVETIADAVNPPFVGIDDRARLAAREKESANG